MEGVVMDEEEVMNEDMEVNDEEPEMTQSEKV